MRKICFFLLFAFIKQFSVSAQNGNDIRTAPIIKDWQMIGESKNHVDVFYRIVRCNNTNQLQLKILSESNIDQTVEFDITVINKLDKEQFTKSVSRAISKMQTVQGDCFTELSDLKIFLPEKYYALNLDVKIIFKQ
jgi:hypothetical protein